MKSEVAPTCSQAPPGSALSRGSSLVRKRWRGRASRKFRPREDPGTERSLPLVPAELEPPAGQLLADLVEAGDAEVFALQQVVARLADQFTDERQAEPSHALAGTNGKVEIGNRPLEQGLLIGRHRRQVEDRLGR